MSEFRGYDPALENLDALRAECIEYTPLCEGIEVKFQPKHPKEWMRIENQNPLPSCQGHMTSTGAEWLYYLATEGQVIQFSRQFAWSRSQVLDGGRPSISRGASIQSGVKLLKTVGIPEEDLAPYSKTSFRYEYPPEVYENASQFKIKNSVNLDSATKCFDFLQAGVGAIFFCVPWEFRRGAWHAIAGVGVPINDKICIANSWGPDWDGDGWVEWDHDKTQRYLDTNGGAAIGITDMERPHVRRGWNPESGGFA